jgi:hypothetical protein
MTLRLPEQYYRPKVDRTSQRRGLALLAAGLVLLCAWQLLGLPGNMIKRYDPPLDMPWFGFGLSGVFVEQDGRWVIHREGYADRMRKYKISPYGTLAKFEESGVYDLKLDTSGGKGHGVVLPGGGVLNVKVSRQYYGWLKKVRSGNGERSSTGDVVISTPEPGPVTPPPAQSLPSYSHPGSMPTAQQPYVIVRVYKNSQPQEYNVLSGYHYYPVFDSVCYVAPYLWITTDRLHYLHRIYLNDKAGPVEIRVEKTLPLDLGVQVEHDTSLGVDHHRGMLYLVLPTGERYWFDTQQVKLHSQDKLPGVWEAEYACLGDPRPDYSFDRGVPLAKWQYQLLLRCLVVVFLGSLLYLAVQWRQAWKYIAVATTVASSSSGKSSPISKGSDTAV